MGDYRILLDFYRILWDTIWWIFIGYYRPQKKGQSQSELRKDNVIRLDDFLVFMEKRIKEDHVRQEEELREASESDIPRVGGLVLMCPLTPCAHDIHGLFAKE